MSDSDILSRILTTKAEEIIAAQVAKPFASVHAEARMTPPARGFADALRARVNGMRAAKRLDPRGKFGGAQAAVAVFVRRHAGESGLEVIAHCGELGQVQLVDEGLADARLVIAEPDRAP